VVGKHNILQFLSHFRLMMKFVVKFWDFVESLECFVKGR
jgi:hypothetical protein